MGAEMESPETWATLEEREEKKSREKAKVGTLACHLQP